MPVAATSITTGGYTAPVAVTRRHAEPSKSVVPLGGIATDTLSFRAQ
jgi:hypothetical protein